MVYKLEEFKTWLAQDESRKEGLNWGTILPQIKDDNTLQSLIQWTNFPKKHVSGWEKCRAIALKGKLENLIQQRKATIQQEITLLKGVLENSHEQQ